MVPVPRGHAVVRSTSKRPGDEAQTCHDNSGTKSFLPRTRRLHSLSRIPIPPSSRPSSVTGFSPSPLVWVLLRYAPPPSSLLSHLRPGLPPSLYSLSLPLSFGTGPWVLSVRSGVGGVPVSRIVRSGTRSIHLKLK